MSKFLRCFAVLSMVFSSTAFLMPQAAQAGVAGLSTDLISGALQRSSRNILASEPDLSGNLENAPSGDTSQLLGFSARAPRSNVVFGLDGSLSSLMSGNNLLAYVGGQQDSSMPQEDIAGRSQEYNAWAQGGFVRSVTSGQAQNLGVLHVGGDYLVDPNIRVGAIGQIDMVNETNIISLGDSSGTGWMVGPYIVARVLQNVIFDGRIAYGQSYNQHSWAGFVLDNFNTSRVLIRSQITGDFDHEMWTITPQLTLNYLREEQHAYVNSFSVGIPGRTQETGQVLLGSDISTTYLSGGVLLTPRLGARGAWNFLDTGSSPRIPLSARVNVGLDILFATDTQLKLEGFYEGLGVTNYDSLGATAKFLGQF